MPENIIQEWGNHLMNQFNKKKKLKIFVLLDQNQRSIPKFNHIVTTSNYNEIIILTDGQTKY
ncbi:unnamed protein product [Paramecium octaurelia]|uniref:Uncharacterized protein n=1 Tax=Paramecium octaurelia TaxID=43137 RepID=A0A8S1WH73_PAROT|nr:unnamed protein product [Paramecium octaurelia]